MHWHREMTSASAKAARPINGMESEQDAPEAQTAPLEGEYVQRRRRRRLDLNTLDGTKRESARIYREVAERRISLVEGDVRSRILRRHSEILDLIEEKKYRAQLIDEATRSDLAVAPMTHQTSGALADQRQPEPVSEGEVLP